MVTGQCLCGRVKFKVSGELGSIGVTFNAMTVKYFLSNGAAASTQDLPSLVMGLTIRTVGRLDRIALHVTHPTVGNQPTLTTTLPHLN